MIFNVAFVVLCVTIFIGLCWILGDIEESRITQEEPQSEPQLRQVVFYDAEKDEIFLTYDANMVSNTSLGYLRDSLIYVGEL